ncbi:hypothetical protein LTR85_001117 [Meristemomyces frigidus]|nr:hypothetical protein LTR85_001117 [Meristemomyces frigidus]
MATSDFSPPTKKVKYNFLETIVVLVGQDKTAFTVHKDIICERSPFFRAACAARWQDSDAERDVKLIDDDPEVFTLYLQCVYRESATVDLAEAKVEVATKHNVDECPESDAVFAILAEAYILADKLGDTRSCNLIIDEYISCSDQLGCIPTTVDIMPVYENTPSGSPLRALTVDYYLFEAPLSTVVKTAATLPAAFLSEFIIADANLKNPSKGETVEDVYGKVVSEMAQCCYHKHDDDNPSITCGVNQQKSEKSPSLRERQATATVSGLAAAAVVSD